MDQVKKKKSGSEEISHWECLAQQLEDEKNYDYPPVTVVIPTYNCAQTIDFTLQSVIKQTYPDLEIIIVDACSKDRTMEIVKSYREVIDRIYTVTDYNLYEMMNRGLSLSQGMYVSFFFPGDYYISQDAFGHMMRVAVDNHLPDLVYCGCLLRDDYKEPRVLMRPLNWKVLKLGKQPTSIQSCWFKTDTLNRLGKFATSYQLRGGYELFCRFCQEKGLTYATSHRVLTDYDRRGLTAKMMLRHSQETLYIVFRHFGFLFAFKWWLFQNHMRFFKWWMKTMKAVVLGK